MFDENDIYTVLPEYRELYYKLGEEAVGDYFLTSESISTYNPNLKWQELFDDYHLFEFDYSDEMDFDSIDTNENMVLSICEWCRKNCVGDWNHYNSFYWVFEKPSDLMFFKLRWA